MKKYNIFENMIYIFKLQIKYSRKILWWLPIYTLSSIVLPITAALIPTLLVWFIENHVSTSIFVSATLGVLLFYVFLKSINAWLKESINWNNTFVRMNRSELELAEKNITMDYANLEPNEGRLRYKKAMRAIQNNWTGVERIMKSAPAFFINLTGIIVYIFFLGRISWIILLILSLMTIANIGLSNYANYYQRKTNPSLDIDDSKMYYLSNETLKTETAKDIRIYKMQKWIGETCEFLTKRISKTYLKQGTINNFPSFSDAIFTIIRDLVAYSILIKGVIAKEYSPTEFTLYIGIIAGFTTWLNGFTEELLNIKLASTRVNDFRYFITYPDTFLREEGISCKEMKNKPLSIAFEHVSFSYPESDKEIISDLSFKIKAREKIALVGINGAGKTTIIKLLTGLYIPTKGRILVDNKDISKLNIKEYYELIGAIFQDVETTAYTIKENISCKLESETDEKLLEECLIKADLYDKVNKLKYKENTYLSKTLDQNGVELSGGEKQKLMLARALYKDAPILILDEPTAALDPLAESDLYNKYNSLTQNKTSIFISHRLSSTQFCDYIFYLENGAIKEEGTHQDLMELNGEYKKMFDIQSQYYKDGENNENFF